MAGDLHAFETHGLGLVAWCIQERAAQLTGWSQTGAALMRSQFTHEQLRTAFAQSPMFVYDKQLSELRGLSRCARQQ